MHAEEKNSRAFPITGNGGAEVGLFKASKPVCLPHFSFYLLCIDFL
jgi:hypothetical protein